MVIGSGRGPWRGDGWAWPGRACAVHSTRQAKESRYRGKMEDFQASEEVTSGWAVGGRVAAEIRVWRSPAWEDTASRPPGPRLMSLGGGSQRPLSVFPAWAVPAVRRDGAGLLFRWGSRRREDDITPPLPLCCRPQPGPRLGKEASCCGMYSDTGAQGQLG